MVLKYHQTLELFYLSFGPIQGVSFLPYEMAAGKTRHIYLYNNIKGWKKKTLAFCFYLRSKKELFKKSLHQSADHPLRLTKSCQKSITEPISRERTGSLQLARTNRASLLGLEKGPEAHGLLSTEQNEHSLIQEGGDWQRTLPAPPVI